MPPTLGQRLKHAREKRGLSLRDVEHTTRISVPRLQDLEDDKLNTFGGMAYAKCFLRTYATLMGVDADEVLGQMNPPPLGGLPDYRYLVENHGPWVVDRRHRQASYAPTPGLGPGKPFFLMVIAAFAVLLVIGGGVLANAFFHTNSGATASDNPGSKASASAVAAEDANGASPSKAAYLTPDQLPKDSEFQVYDVRVALTPDKASASKPPKAVPVPEPSGRPAAAPPKAIPVR